MPVVEVHSGSSPLILSFPHTGTFVPKSIWERLNDNGQLLADTDWHLHRLYEGLLDHVTTVRATFHRYVIDANRDPMGMSLYPGQNTTALIPETDFDGVPIWREDQAPTAADVASRVNDFHAPYHAALLREIERVRSVHGVCAIYDCHSIRSRIPFLFDGTLPDFNIGTDNGTTCHPQFESVAVDITRAANSFTSVLNGRFKGGWTTRHYGNPASMTPPFRGSPQDASFSTSRSVHAIQMELAQSTYLQSELPPFAYDETKAPLVRAPLKTVLTQLEQVALTLKSN